jgi:hypothetical protein
MFSQRGADPFQWQGARPEGDERLDVAGQHGRIDNDDHGQALPRVQRFAPG